jgi:hypothetical protein
MDKGFGKITKGYREGEVVLFRKNMPNNKAELAIELIAKWGLVSAKDDGEDTAGRHKLTLMPVSEVVERAIEMADQAITEMEKRGWFINLPEPDNLAIGE